ncbi:MAG: serine/threonine protein phosphatase PrpC [Candidatus Azotimanducaceae bacterium]|jgi:serine/threonine protein phosphatase PrpC
MNLRGKVEIVCQTDVGQVRDHNEDYVSSDDRIGLAVLADGMGGLNAGEVASSMSVHLLMDELRAYAEGESTLEQELAEGDDRPNQSQIVERAIEKANSSVFHVSQTQPHCEGMGTTIVVSMFYDNKVTIGHIGDSRVYRFRDNKLEQVTKDHSFVQELIDKGLYTKDEARASSKKNVVTRALGVAPKVVPEVHEYKVKQGDVFLMCSDGLTDLVGDSDIEKTFRELGSNLSVTAGHLVEVANASGGKDNISVVLIRINKAFPEKAGLLKRVVDWFE